MASTIDFFYPIVDDAEIQGEISAANVLSDLFAIGIEKIDHFLVILGLSTKLKEDQRAEVATQILKGLERKVGEAGGEIKGGQTVLNPWVMSGGFAMGFSDNKIYGNEFFNRNARKGDKILLTKKLGTQMIVNFHQMFRKNSEKAEKLKLSGKISEASLSKSYIEVVDSMRRLNLEASRSMNKFGNAIKCSTDITGFGIKGHSDNLVQIQKHPVDFHLKHLPVFSCVKGTDKIVRDFGMELGTASETSGGLMIVIEESQADNFVRDMKMKGQECWIIGDVIEGNRNTIIDQQTLYFE